MLCSEISIFATILGVGIGLFDEAGAPSNVSSPGMGRVWSMVDWSVRSNDERNDASSVKGLLLIGGCVVGMIAEAAVGAISTLTKQKTDKTFIFCHPTLCVLSPGR